MHRILVFDLGGGTFDLTILEVLNNHFKVKAIAGDNHLGGQDIDNIISEHFFGRYQDEEGEDLRKKKKLLAVFKE